MVETYKRSVNNAKSMAGPHKDLYIYWIEGHIESDEEAFGNAFIGNWEEDDFSFLFFSTPSDDKVDKLLSSRPGLTLRDKYNMTYSDWLGETPSSFWAGRFLISPPWESVDSPGDGLNIILDPGVVFGTGTHPTTRNCLEALESACCEETIESVLDLGTGTGLLALAAARLGCSRILAVDNNFLAVRTARKNIQLNRLEDKILSLQGKAEDCIAWHTDLVVANIHYAAMEHVINSDHFYHKKYFILSGLLRSQAKDVADRLAQRHADIIKEWRQDGIWHTFFGKVS